MKNEIQDYSWSRTKKLAFFYQSPPVKVSLILTLTLLGVSIFPSHSVPEEKKVRIGFFSDIHFDVTKRPDTKFGGVGDDRPGKVNFEIPLQVKSTIGSINPDFVFDCGDMTDHGEDHEYRAYQSWRKTIEAPIYAVMGNHDREHKRPSQPYGTGFYSICGYNAATKVLKMGNLVFILISEDHHYEFHELDAAISTQKFDWIENQLDRYSEDQNNIFIIEHYPIKNTMAWSQEPRPKGRDL